MSVPLSGSYSNILAAGIARNEKGSVVYIKTSMKDFTLTPAGARLLGNYLCDLASHCDDLNDIDNEQTVGDIDRDASSLWRMYTQPMYINTKEDADVADNKTHVVDTAADIRNVGDLIKELIEVLRPDGEKSKSA